MLSSNNGLVCPLLPTQMHHQQGFAGAAADAVTRSAPPLSGANILHKHSINSLLEQQDLIERSAAVNQKMTASQLDSKCTYFNNLVMQACDVPF